MSRAYFCMGDEAGLAAIRQLVVVKAGVFAGFTKAFTKQGENGHEDLGGEEHDADVHAQL
jgi:hypothetical protein